MPTESSRQPTVPLSSAADGHHALDSVNANKTVGIDQAMPTESSRQPTVPLSSAADADDAVDSVNANKTVGIDQAMPTECSRQPTVPLSSAADADDAVDSVNANKTVGIDHRSHPKGPESTDMEERIYKIPCASPSKAAPGFEEIESIAQDIWKMARSRDAEGLKRLVADYAKKLDNAKSNSEKENQKASTEPTHSKSLAGEQSFQASSAKNPGRVQYLNLNHKALTGLSASSSLRATHGARTVHFAPIIATVSLTVEGHLKVRDVPSSFGGGSELNASRQARHLLRLLQPFMASSPHRPRS
jgi:hypothetical protein